MKIIQTFGNLIRQSIAEQFLAVVENRLGSAPQYIEPGRFHRFSTNSNRAKKSGYLKLWADGRGGIFGDFRTGVAETWFAQHRTMPPSAERKPYKPDREQFKAKSDRDHIEKQERNRDIVRSIWLGSEPLSGIDPASKYLASRGLAELWPLPRALRFHPALPYWHDGQMLGLYPAMVARFHGIDGRCVAIHQTFLTQQGSKADLPLVKKWSLSSGGLTGGAIPLAIPRNGDLGIAEGIETALCASLGSGLPVVAAGSAACLAGYNWPKGTRRLVIFADNDASGVGQAAAERLARRGQLAGLMVVVLTPSDVGTDWADVWAHSKQKAGCAE